MEGDDDHRLQMLRRLRADGVSNECIMERMRLSSTQLGRLVRMLDLPKRQRAETARRHVAGNTQRIPRGASTLPPLPSLVPP